ncbi:MAG: YdeI/OmpD-associated family protein [Planctomycetota bacterium]
MSDYPYEFDAKIVKYDFGTMYYSVVYAPKSILSKIDFSQSKRVRIDGEINGIRIEAALMPTKGKWYLMVSKKLQKLLGVSLGDTVTVAFDIADPNAVSVPIELQYALEANEDALSIWNKWTAGKRRSCCHHVNSAKMAETRERRVEEIIDLLMKEL